MEIDEDFALWMQELKEYYLDNVSDMTELDFDKNLSDPELWTEYFDGGYTPEEAAKEDMSYWEY